jgi:hypothetical protein
LGKPRKARRSCSVTFRDRRRGGGGRAEDGVFSGVSSSKTGKTSLSTFFFKEEVSSLVEVGCVEATTEEETAAVRAAGSLSSTATEDGESEEEAVVAGADMVARDQ